MIIVIYDSYRIEEPPKKEHNFMVVPLG